MNVWLAPFLPIGRIDGWAGALCGAATNVVDRGGRPRQFQCMTGVSLCIFFFFFGAATKCAMCYVAWFGSFFILFFYNLQSSFCSPRLYKP